MIKRISHKEKIQKIRNIIDKVDLSKIRERQKKKNFKKLKQNMTAEEWDRYYKYSKANYK